MKTLLRLVVLVLVALAIGLLSKYGSYGRVIILLSSYRVDVSLMTVLFSLFFGFILVYYLIRFCVNVTRWPGKIRTWRSKRALLLSRSYLNSAGLNYFEGKYNSAYKNALASIDKETNKDNKFLALMLAFKSSGFMRNYDRQEQILHTLEEYTEKKWNLAKFMAVAETQYMEQKYGLCLDNLSNILGLDRKHIPAHRLMLKAYLQLNNYEKAFSVLSWLIKYDYLEKHKAEHYKVRVLSGLFAGTVDVDDLKHIYNSLESKDRQDGQINSFYLHALLRLKQYNVLIKALKDMDVFDLSFAVSDLLLILAKSLEQDTEIKDLLKLCKSHLSKHEDDGVFLLVLGILFYKQNEQLTAMDYLKKSLSVKKTLDACLYLVLVAKLSNNAEQLNYAEQLLLENINLLV